MCGELCALFPFKYPFFVISTKKELCQLALHLLGNILVGLFLAGIFLEVSISFLLAQIRCLLSMQQEQSRPKNLPYCLSECKDEHEWVVKTEACCSCWFFQHYCTAEHTQGTFTLFPIEKHLKYCKGGSFTVSCVIQGYCHACSAPFFFCLFVFWREVRMTVDNGKKKSPYRLLKCWVIASVGKTEFIYVVF